VDDAPIREAYCFLCQDCGHVWQESYEIRRVHDSRGQIQSAFFLEGRRVTSPLTQGRCAACGSARVLVTPLSRGRRRRGGAMMETSS
jgi:hypothetical protein